METGTQSVVDPKSFKVHGMEGIRVVDASAMPCIPNANINAPTLMHAEKAADMILQNTPLHQQVQKFYRACKRLGKKSISLKYPVNNCKTSTLFITKQINQFNSYSNCTRTLFSQKALVICESRICASEVL